MLIDGEVQDDDPMFTDDGGIEAPKLEPETAVKGMRRRASDWKT